MSLSDIPAGLSGPTKGAQSRYVRHAKGSHHGHFLSIIGFDGKMTIHTFNACMQAQGTMGQLWRGFYNHGGEGQIRARNECTFKFLASPCSHHLLLDSDLAFGRDHVLSLRNHPEAEDSIICGVYCKKSNRVEMCYNSLKDNPEPDAKSGLLEVATAGTGFMQVPRKAYLKIMAKYPERWYSCDYLFEKNEDGTDKLPLVRAKKFSFYFQDVFFDKNTGLIRDMTEDWSFCHMAREAGVKVYLDMKTAQAPWVNHLGNAFYPLETEIERMALEAQVKEANDRLVSAGLEPTTAATVV